MAAVNYIRKRQKSDDLIRKYGNPAKLVSLIGERDCVAVEVQLSSSERSQLPANTDGVYLISAIELPSFEDAPDFDKETLVILDRDTLTEVRRFKISTPALPLAPGGVVIYWEVNTRGQARAS